MATEYAKALGALLRSVRRRHGLSLREVEERSGGRWKSVVVGSYERGDRAVTVQGLAELADLYGVPVAALLPDLGTASLQHEDPGLVLDLEAVAAARDPQAAALQRYVQTLLGRRDDPAERVLTLRVEDVAALASVYGLDAAGLEDRLRAWSVLERG